jgi:hypothetical protein
MGSRPSLQKQGVVMPQQRMFTVASAISSKFAIVWTRSTALARAWASQKWEMDAVFVDVWPTRPGDQRHIQEIGDKEHYA